MKKKKPMACENCYMSRVKCVYNEEGEDERCERCVRQNKPCVSRSVNKSKNGSEGGSFTRELDLNAYKALEIIEDNPHLTQHYNGASAFVKTYKALGYTSPPGSVKAFIHSLYLVATKDKSVGRLHAATTLAVSTGVEIDMVLLNAKDAPATEQEKCTMRDLVHSKYLFGNEGGACFIIRHDAGNRDVIAKPEFEDMFIDARSIAKSHVRNSEPHFKIWRQFVADPKDCDTFSSKIIQAIIRAESISGPLPDSYFWECKDGKLINLRDNRNNPFKGELYEAGYYTKTGFLNYMVLGFKNLQPLDEAGASRLRSLKIPFRTNSQEPLSTPPPQPISIPAKPCTYHPIQEYNSDSGDDESRSSKVTDADSQHNVVKREGSGSFFPGAHFHQQRQLVSKHKQPPPTQNQAHQIMEQQTQAPRKKIHPQPAILGTAASAEAASALFSGPDLTVTHPSPSLPTAHQPQRGPVGVGAGSNPEQVRQQHHVQQPHRGQLPSYGGGFSYSDGSDMYNPAKSEVSGRWCPPENPRHPSDQQQLVHHQQPPQRPTPPPQQQPGQPPPPQQTLPQHPSETKQQIPHRFPRHPSEQHPAALQSQHTQPQQLHSRPQHMHPHVTHTQGVPQHQPQGGFQEMGNSVPNIQRGVSREPPKGRKQQPRQGNQQVAQSPPLPPGAAGTHMSQPQHLQEQPQVPHMYRNEQSIIQQSGYMPQHQMQGHGPQHHLPPYTPPQHLHHMQQPLNSQHFHQQQQMAPNSGYVGQLQPPQPPLQPTDGKPVAKKSRRAPSTDASKKSSKKAKVDNTTMLPNSAPLQQQGNLQPPMPQNYYGSQSYAPIPFAPSQMPQMGSQQQMTQGPYPYYQPWAGYPQQQQQQQAATGSQQVPGMGHGPPGPYGYATPQAVNQQLHQSTPQQVGHPMFMNSHLGPVSGQGNEEKLEASKRGAKAKTKRNK